METAVGNCKILKNKLSYNYIDEDKNGSGDKFHQYLEVNLIHLKDVLTFKEKETVIVVNFNGRYVSGLNRGGTYNKTLTDRLYVTVCDFQIKNRLVKAFKHLTYLAAKKREEERKASGDKF